MLQLSCAESLFICYLLLFFVCCFGPSFGWQHRHSCSGSSIGEDGVGIGEGCGGVACTSLSARGIRSIGCWHFEVPFVVLPRSAILIGELSHLVLLCKLHISLPSQCGLHCQTRVEASTEKARQNKEKGVYF